MLFVGVVERVVGWIFGGDGAERSILYIPPKPPRCRTRGGVRLSGGCDRTYRPAKG